MNFHPFSLIGLVWIDFPDIASSRNHSIYRMDSISATVRIYLCSSALLYFQKHKTHDTGSLQDNLIAQIEAV